MSLGIHNSEDRLIIFNLWKADRENIEAEMGSSLIWEEKPEKKSSHIIVRNLIWIRIKRMTGLSSRSGCKQLERFRMTFGLELSQ